MGTPNSSVHRILVPHDFGVIADGALLEAVRFAEAFGARITLLHVVPDLVEGGDDAAEMVRRDMPEVAERRASEAQRALERVANGVRGSGIPIRTVVRSGRPWEEIVAEASKERVDLAVTGTHGRKGLSHLVLGSVAERVLRTARCPVLSVRDPAPTPSTPLAEETRGCP